MKPCFIASLTFILFLNFAAAQSPRPLCNILFEDAAKTSEFKTAYKMRYVPIAILDENLPASVQRAISKAQAEADASFERYLKRHHYSSELEAREAVKSVMSAKDFNIKVGERVNPRLTPNLLRARYAQEILEQKQASVIIQRVPKINGRGVFAKEAIRKGDFLGEYGGVTRPMDLVGDLKNMYLMETPFKYYGNPVIIDGESSGNFARFLNHSSLPVNDPKGVNAAFSEIILNGRPLIIIFALRDIQPGEQILINYGAGYWKGLGIDPKLFE